jgi:hypothetical protein
MFMDPEDNVDGFTIVGDDRVALIAEAYAHLFPSARSAKLAQGCGGE